ncbi:MAG: GcrA family cell cycle regulator [Pikeienuella sp.]
MTWTDERVEKLKEFWAEGMSASQIAKQLGGVTRNAVIGKVHRLGLSHRSSGEATRGPEDGAAQETAAPEPAAASEAPEPAAEPDAPPPAESTAEEAPRTTVPAPRDPSLPRAPGQPTPEEEAARVTLAEIEKMAKKLDLLELTERTCKWPIGDPAEDGFHFCGLPAVPGKPYCKHHVAVAFQPMSARRDRSRASR